MLLYYQIYIFRKFLSHYSSYSNRSAGHPEDISYIKYYTEFDANNVLAEVFMINVVFVLQLQSPSSIWPCVRERNILEYILSFDIALHDKIIV